MSASRPIVVAGIVVVVTGCGPAAGPGGAPLPPATTGSVGMPPISVWPGDASTVSTDGWPAGPTDAGPTPVDGDARPADVADVPADAADVFVADGADGDAALEPTHVHLPFPGGWAWKVIGADELEAARALYGDSYVAFVTPGTALPVLAGASGTVVSIEDQHVQGGLLPEMMVFTNQVVVALDDGTVAVYMHLQQGSASVLLDPGMHVEVGRMLGLSGATGFVAGPRVGFALYRNGEPVSYCFETPTSGCVSPGPGDIVPSANPGT